MLLTIQSRSKSIKSISSDEFFPISFTNDIIELIAKDNKLAKNRIRLTIDQDGKRTPLEINKQLKSYGITKDTTISVKDLGPQISWKGVFLAEYFGPIVIHSILFFGIRELIGFYDMSVTQTLLYDLSLIHYMKREYETLFVHKFSNATMPFTNIFKNSFHYWVLNGVLCGVFTYGSESLRFSDNKLVSTLFHVNEWSHPSVALFAVVILLLEFANYKTHSILSAIRDKDPKNYQIPYGFGFNWVSCPNYLFEISVWIVFTIFSGNWAYAVFTLVGALQMYVWAIAKHKRYLKTFGDEYKKLNRKVLIPYVL